MDSARGEGERESELPSQMSNHADLMEITKADGRRLSFVGEE